MRTTLKILTTVFSIAYPVLLVFKPGLVGTGILCLTTVWFLRFCFERKTYMSGLVLFFIIAFFFKKISFLYPVLINLMFLIFFAYSLKKEPIITKFAKIKEPNLSKEAEIYTANLTKIWVAFFVLNGSLCFGLYFINEQIWAVYCGLISYILIGFLMTVEIIYRKFVKRFRFDR